MRHLIKSILVLIIVGLCHNGWSAQVEEKVAHIYVDLATIPALVQMVDAVKQPADDPKLFIWKRFYELSPDDPVLQELNAVMPKTKFLGEFNYNVFSDLVDENVKAFYQKYPDYHFIVHLNALHLKRSGHIFNIIPEKQIKAVHLYEDSVGRSYWDEEMLTHYQEVKVPVQKYIHIGFYNPEIIPPEEYTIVFIDFYELAKTMSVAEKEKIAKLMGFDLNQYSQIINNKRTIVFLDDPHLNGKQARLFFEELFKKNKRLKFYKWIYKNHPRVEGKGKAFDVLKEISPSVFVLPNEMPIESLILCGYEPTYIAGYGSSAFFSFKREKILGYIKRFYLEDYLQPLMELNILDSDVVFSLP